MKIVNKYYTLEIEKEGAKMNRQTRNAIAMAIGPHTGHGRTRTDYFHIIDHVRAFGFQVTEKVADDYTADMSRKHNAYKLVDMRTDKELDSLLVIDEYFGHDYDRRTHEINCYIS
jgi:hypothetical protein